MNAMGSTGLSRVEHLHRLTEDVAAWKAKAYAPILAAETQAGKKLHLKRLPVDVKNFIWEKSVDLDYGKFASTKLFRHRVPLILPKSGWLIAVTLPFMIGSRALMGHMRDLRARKQGQVANELGDVLRRDIWATFWFFFGVEIFNNGLIKALKKTTGINLADKSGSLTSYSTLSTNFAIKNRNTLSGIIKDPSARQAFFKALPGLSQLNAISDKFKAPLQAFEHSAGELKALLAKLDGNGKTAENGLNKLSQTNQDALEAAITKTYTHFDALLNTRNQVSVALSEKAGLTAAQLGRFQKTLKIERFVAEHISNKVRLPLDWLSMAFVWGALGLLPVWYNKIRGEKQVAQHLQQAQPGSLAPTRSQQPLALQPPLPKAVAATNPFMQAGQAYAPAFSQSV
ncbi:MAG: hypothetical protein VKJ06_04265 [Vampirovibrionales bacterium]|nr:hypothetical protein [Vampirovibrionales bacterium]